MYVITWTLTAELTYYKEIDFILNKWPFDEAEKFIELVEEKLKTLGTGTMSGKPSNVKDVSILVISKQTSLAYRIFKNQSRIELLTFWNNKVNPNDYKEFLEI
jgi:plasmid stabilization system protein ParE